MANRRLSAWDAPKAAFREEAKDGRNIVGPTPFDASTCMRRLPWLHGKQRGATRQDNDIVSRDDMLNG